MANWWLTRCLVLNCTLVLVRASINQAEETFQLLHEGDVNIQLGNNDNLIVVLGVTGSGKSTLIQFLAGDNSKLVGKRRGFDIIIEDGNQKIGLTTLQSKTLYPELVVDPLSGASFVDCPGFFDTRNSSIEIAASYFIKKVFDQAKEVKLVFTIAQSALRVGNDRRGLPDLLAYASGLVVDIEKYKNSMSLVVTKVDNYPPMDDLEIIEYIREFLLEAREEIKSKIGEESKMILNKKMVKIVDYFLDEENGGKIGIFRRPDKIGPLSKSKLLQAGKAHLQSMLFFVSKFTLTANSDFRYSLSSDSILYIKDILIGLVDTKIIKFLTSLSTELYSTYKLKGEISKDMYTFRDQLVTSINKFSQIRNDVNMGNNLITPILTCMQCVETTVYNKDKINEIFTLVAQANAFKTFIEDNSSNHFHVWIKPITEFILYLQNLSNWYSLLPDIYNAMSTHDFQKQKETYINKFGSAVITNENVKNFLARVGDLNLKNLTVLNEVIKADLKIDNFLLRDINSVMDASLKSEYSLCTELEIFEVYGNYVLLSEAIVKSKTVCRKTIKSLVINALDTLYIDTSINMIGKEVKVIFFAPKWVVIGNVEIKLDGQSGSVPSAMEARSGSRPGERGTNGIPGTPGGTPGSFFGIGLVFENSENLLITTNGGNGGPGQNGGIGAKGTDGTVPDFHYGSHQGDFEDHLRSKGYEFSMNKDDGDDNFLVYRNKREYFKYTIFGKIGSPGSQGGDGGVGGIGASAGSINIIDIGSSLKIRTANNSGKKGAPGQGGRGGAQGGNRGIKYVACSRKVERVFGFKTKDRWSCDITKTDLLPYSKGTSGANNANTHSLQQPEISKILLPTTQIIKYKTYVRKHAQETVVGDIKLKFLNNLDINKNVHAYFSIVDFVNDYKEIEKMMYIVDTDINFIPIYESMLNGIGTAIKNKLNLQDLKVLNFLYSAILANLSNLKYKSNKFLIIDLTNYVDFAIQNINDLKENVKNIVIDDIKNTYELSIDKTIADVNSFINDHINVEFDALKNEIDITVDNLLSETVALKSDAESKRIELMKLERETRYQLEKKNKFNFFKLASTALSFFGPIGSVVNGLTGVLSNTVGSNIFGEIVQNFDVLLPISNAIKEVDGKIGAFINDGISKVNKVFSFAKVVTDRIGIVFPQLSIKISRTIDEFKDNTLDVSEEIINDFKNKFLEGVTDVIDNITISKYTNPGTNNLKYFLNNIKDLVPLAEIASEDVKKYQHDNDKLREIGQAIIDTEQTIKNLNAFQYNIFYEIAPFLTMVQRDTSDLLKKLEGNSPAFLDFSKWNVQKYLRKATTQMKRFVAGFKTEDEFVRCFTQLEELSNLLIGLFDRIQGYQEQKRLADYIAMVSSANVRRISVTDPAHQKAINDLEFVIGSNIIIGQCNRIISSFKQQIFPFGEFYFENLKDRLTINRKLPLEDMVIDAIDKIKYVKIKLVEIETSIINGRDKLTHYGIFSSQYTSSRPFSVWNYSSIPNEINSLLKGSEVTLLADVTRSGVKNAVKFSNLHLDIKINDDKIDNDFQNILKNFDIEMTHLGNSYYKCDGKYFVIHTESQTISYSYERDSNNEPIRSNQVYRKILRGDILLSPYAMWNLKLVSIAGVSFDIISKYKDSMSLELVGKGQFVDDNSNVCRNNLEQYYEKYEVTMTDIFDFIRNEAVETMYS